jgi:hypothetical protein
VPRNAGALDVRYGAPNIDAIVTFLQQPHEFAPMQMLRPCNSSWDSSRATIHAAKIGASNSGKDLGLRNIHRTPAVCYANHLNH